ncbi:MAG: hypothetical protein KatS3mg105_1095 [Gemmatales bacterium]|nr:MAG: hypothetical protein KatS3mg105_1095 [Gemmatales bacterium]
MREFFTVQWGRKVYRITGAEEKRDDRVCVSVIGHVFFRPYRRFELWETAVASAPFAREREGEGNDLAPPDFRVSRLGCDPVDGLLWTTLYTVALLLPAGSRTSASMLPAAGTALLPACCSRSAGTHFRSGKLGLICR